MNIELSKLELAQITLLVGEVSQFDTKNMAKQYSDTGSCDYYYQEYIAQNVTDINSFELFRKLSNYIQPSESYEYKVLMKDIDSEEFCISSLYYASLDEVVKNDFETPISLILETKRLKAIQACTSYLLKKL